MKLLLIHAEVFSYEKRYKHILMSEDVSDEPEGFSFRNVLVVFLCLEKRDFLSIGEVLDKALLKISSTAKTLGVSSIVLYPHPYFSLEPAEPREVAEVLKKLCDALKPLGINVHRAPVSWRKRFMIRYRKDKPYEYFAEITPKR